MSVSCRYRGGGLIKNKQEAFSTVLAQIFGTGNLDTGKVTPPAPAAKFPERQPVDTNKQAAKV